MQGTEFEFQKLLWHAGHHIVCVPYGNEESGVVNMSIECEDCGEVLYDINKPDTMDYVPIPEMDGEENEN